MILWSLTLSHKLGGLFFFFSLGADGESACNSTWAKAQRQCFAVVDYSERQGCNGSYKWWVSLVTCSLGVSIWAAVPERVKERKTNWESTSVVRPGLGSWTLHAAVAAAVLQIALDSQRLWAMNECHTEWMNGGVMFKTTQHDIHTPLSFEKGKRVREMVHDLFNPSGWHCGNHILLLLKWTRLWKSDLCLSRLTFTLSVKWCMQRSSESTLYQHFLPPWQKYIFK